jgi:hypothetical protein
MQQDDVLQHEYKNAGSLACMLQKGLISQEGLLNGEHAANNRLLCTLIKRLQC